MKLPSPTTATPSAADRTHNTPPPYERLLAHEDLGELAVLDHAIVANDSLLKHSIDLSPGKVVISNSETILKIGKYEVRRIVPKGLFDIAWVTNLLLAELLPEVGHDMSQLLSTRRCISLPFRLPEANCICIYEVGCWT